MGGLGSGGQPGMGAKPKDRAARFLHGARGANGERSRPKPLQVLAPRPDLTAKARELWLELAPFGADQRTLSAATSRAFGDLCELIVKRDDIWAQVDAEGLTFLKVTVDGSGQEHTEPKAHPLLARHAALQQRVEAGMARFRLAPVGKEFVVPETEVDAFAEFEEPQGEPQ